MVSVEHIQSVLVGSHPTVSLAVNHCACDTTLSYLVGITQLISCIPKF